MANVKDNVDAFQVHPTYALAVMLPDREHTDRMIESLRAYLEDGDVIQVLHGQEGLGILDRRGSRHGLPAWFHRLLQNWTYYEQILGLYGERLSKGEFLVVIPCGLDRRQEVAALAVAQGARGAYYFGFETVESVTGP
jgi:hypothetical protein